MPLPYLFLTAFQSLIDSILVAATHNQVRGLHPNAGATRHMFRIPHHGLQSRINNMMGLLNYIKTRQSSELRWRYADPSPLSRTFESVYRLSLIRQRIHVGTMDASTNRNESPNKRHQFLSIVIG